MANAKNSGNGSKAGNSPAKPTTVMNNTGASREDRLSNEREKDPRGAAKSRK